MNESFQKKKINQVHTTSRLRLTTEISIKANDKVKTHKKISRLLQKKKEMIWGQDGHPSTCAALVDDHFFQYS